MSTQERLVSSPSARGPPLAGGGPCGGPPSLPAASLVPPRPPPVRSPPAALAPTTDPRSTRPPIHPICWLPRARQSAEHHPNSPPLPQPQPPTSSCCRHLPSRHLTYISRHGPTARSTGAATSARHNLPARALPPPPLASVRCCSGASSAAAAAAPAVSRTWHVARAAAAASWLRCACAAWRE